MSMVTSGAETWTAHTHRHHAGGTTWLFGPEGPASINGQDPVQAQAQIGTADFLFWNAAGAQGGGLAYPAGQLIPSPTPVFPAGTDPGSVIAWYVEPGGNGNGGPGLFFDALLETAGNWIDWDATNDPFTITRGVRGAGPDGDDFASTGNDEAVVTASDLFPGTNPPLVFDQWLVFGDQLSVSAHAEVTLQRGNSGTAFAIYRRPGTTRPKFPHEELYDPWWWLKNSPVESVQELLGAQSEVSQIATLIDFSAAISDARTRVALQRGLYEALVSTAQRQLNAGEG